MIDGKNIEEIIRPMGNGLSIGGKRRLDALSGLIMSICHQNSMHMSAEGRMVGTITGFVHGLECNPVKVEVSTSTLSCESDKTELINRINERLDTRCYDAVFMAFEAWTSCSETPIRPSLDPNRDEVVFTQVVVNINFQPYIIMVKQQIIRDGKKVQLGEPDFVMCDSRLTRGMMSMSSLRPQTCPIT